MGKYDKLKFLLFEIDISYCPFCYFLFQLSHFDSVLLLFVTVSLFCFRFITICWNWHISMSVSLLLVPFRHFLFPFLRFLFLLCYFFCFHVVTIYNFCSVLPHFFSVSLLFCIHFITFVSISLLFVEISISQHPFHYFLFCLVILFPFRHFLFPFHYFLFPFH